MGSRVTPSSSTRSTTCWALQERKSARRSVQFGVGAFENVSAVKALAAAALAPDCSAGPTLSTPPSPLSRVKPLSPFGNASIKSQ